MIEQEDCASNLGTYTTEAREGDSHSYQYKETQESVQVDGEYEFEFAIMDGFGGYNTNFSGVNNIVLPTIMFIWPIALGLK